MEKFWACAKIESETGFPTKVGRRESQKDEDEEDEYLDHSEPSDETEDPSKPETVEKRKRRMRIRGLKKRKAYQLYEFCGDSHMVGIVFLEIGKVTDLPPEKNLTRTSFDMDPFVVASLGKKTYRTRVIRHCLNPVFNEKMIFQVLRREQTYSIAFTVIDRDKLSGNDFIASASIPLQEITDTAPQANPETGLYELKEPPDSSTMPGKSKNRFKLPLSRSSSSQSLSKLSRLSASRTPSQGPESFQTLAAQTGYPTGLHPGDASQSPTGGDAPEGTEGDPDLHSFTIPLKLKNQEKWEDKHGPELIIRAKYVPYPALRQQFWRAMLKQYDTDESGRISKVELTTMLDTLGSTLKESTIDSFFKRFPHVSSGDDNGDLTYDEAVICLEDQLQIKSRQPVMDRDVTPGLSPTKSLPSGGLDTTSTTTLVAATGALTPISTTSSVTATGSSTPVEPETTSSREQSRSRVDLHNIDDLGRSGEEGEYFDRDDLNDRGEEHVVEIMECPICHQPRLNRRSDADIITHVATCASQDWRQINNIVMAGFVTPSQAQRKWYSKVITKISYGGYKLGANSANILVQDRITGQINEERMSIYVRLGIRLLYKGLKSREMEKKRSTIFLQPLWLWWPFQTVELIET